MSGAQAQSGAKSAPGRPVVRGPVALLLSGCLGLCFGAIMAWLFGVTVAIIGLYFIWPQQGVNHSAGLVQEGLGYVAHYPTCFIASDTVGTAQAMADAVARPFIAIGALHFIRAYGAPVAAGLSKTKRALGLFLRELAKVALIAIYVAQNIAVRAAVLLFALPLLVLLSLLAVIDGLMRRDLRRWSGGRESSFIYHHAKKLTSWGLTGGFALYLSCPFGGIDPVLTVVALCAFAAWSLSMTVASFKKYL
jgi:integrating conjugative element membrane protein (TIGR03747 family)